MSLKRIDVKVEHAVFEEIQALAVKSGAKLHPVTKNPIIQDIVVDLIRIGLENYSIEKTDLTVDQVSEIEEKVYQRLYESLSNTITMRQLDNRAASIIETMNNVIAQLQGQIDQLKEQIKQNSPSQDASKTDIKPKNDLSQVKGTEPANKPNNKGLTSDQRRKHGRTLVKQMSQDDPEVMNHLQEIEKRSSDLQISHIQEIEKKFPQQWGQAALKLGLTDLINSDRK